MAYFASGILSSTTSSKRRLARAAASVSEPLSRIEVRHSPTSSRTRGQPSRLSMMGEVSRRASMHIIRINC